MLSDDLCTIDYHFKTNSGELNSWLLLVTLCSMGYRFYTNSSDENVGYLLDSPGYLVFYGLPILDKF